MQSSTDTKEVENGELKDMMFSEICSLFSVLQRAKGRRYGSSWCKHGEAISIFGNVARKYDRLEKIVSDAANGIQEIPKPDSEESVAETVGDLAIYCTLWLTWISKNRPEEFKHWRERILNFVEGEEHEQQRNSETGKTDKLPQQ